MWLDMILRASGHEHFVGNMPLCAWHNRLGPWQYCVRCMVSDLSSLKLPVPQLGQDGIAMTKSNRVGLCLITPKKYLIDEWETIGSDLGDWKL